MLFLYVVIFIFGYSNSYYIHAEYTGTKWFAYLNLFVNIPAFMIKMYVHVFLISTAFKIQQLFREHGHTKGYFSEIFILLSYALFFGYVLYWFIFKPTIVFFINTQDYECSDFDKTMFDVLVNWMLIAHPLVPQLLFYGLLW
jgi:hypothetical protein